MLGAAEEVATAAIGEEVIGAVAVLLVKKLPMPPPSLLATKLSPSLLVTKLSSPLLPTSCRRCNSASNLTHRATSAGGEHTTGGGSSPYLPAPDLRVVGDGSNTASTNGAPAPGEEEEELLQATWPTITGNGGGPHPSLDPTSAGLSCEQAAVDRARGASGRGGACARRGRAFPQTRDGSRLNLVLLCYTLIWSLVSCQDI